MTTFHWAIISSGRPRNVPIMQAHIPEATWYVGAGEAGAYWMSGAKNVIEGGALCRSHNLALAHAFARSSNYQACMLVHDDLKCLHEVCVLPDGRVAREVRTPQEAAELMYQALMAGGVYLAGVAPTANAYFYSQRRPLSFAHFCVGDFCMVRPSPLRFDEQLTLKEDYDFTLQHLTRYGGVVRLNMLLAEFSHRTNAGGAVAYRTQELEEESIQYLQRKWGSAIRRNPRRAHEILLHCPRIDNVTNPFNSKVLRYSNGASTKVYP